MSAEPQVQRFAKALDTFESTEVIKMIGEARRSAFEGDPDSAIQWLVWANGGLPQDVRIKSPLEQVREKVNELPGIEDFKAQNPEYRGASLSNFHLRSDYYNEVQQFILEQVEPLIEQIIDSMQDHNLLFQETRRYHKTDAPQVSQI